MADRRVTFLIGANVKNFTKGLNTAHRSFRRFGKDMQRMGSTLSRNVTLPVLAVGGAVVKAAADFESSFVDIRKTVDASEPTFQMIQGQMRGLAKQIPTSVNELNKLGGVAGQLGIESGNIVAFTETLAKLSDTTDVVGQEGALSLSRFMNVMGTSQKDIDRLGSTIVGLGNNFAAMESEIIDISTSMAPLGNSIGLTEQQVLAFATTIAASGGKIEAASTGFQKTANTIKEAVITGNSNLETFAETAGMSADSFARAFREDAAGALVSFLEGLKRVQDQGGSYAMILKELGLGTQRLTREFGKVLGNLDDLNRAIPLANREWERNTALTEEAQKRYGTFNSRLGILYNNLYDLGIIIGNTLIPTVNKLINASQKVIDHVSGLSGETISLGVAIAGATALVGPLLIVLGKLVVGLSAIMAPAFIAKALLLTLFTGIVVTGQWMVDNFEKISTYFEGLWVAMKQTALISIKGIIEGIKAFINFATMAVPPEFLTGIFGIDLSEMAFDLAGVNDLLEGLNKDIEQAGKRGKELTEQYYKKPFTTIGESAGKALELAKNTIINGLMGILNSSQVQSLISQIEEMFAFDGGGKEEKPQRESPISFANLKSPNLNSGRFTKNLSDMKAAVGEFKTITEAALQGVTEKARITSQVFEQTLTNAITGFAETMGKVFSGDAGAKNFFHGLLMIVIDFANKFGQLLVAAGVAAQAFESLLANPIAAIIAGASLIAITTAIRGLLSDGPGESTSVNDALIRSDGSIVQFHPDDDILAMKDFSNLAPSFAGGRGGGQIIENIVMLDGNVLYRNQKDVNYKKGR